MPGVSSPRTLLAAAISCGVHAILLLLATSVILPDHVPPQLIRVSLLGIGERGQGGGGPVQGAPARQPRQRPPGAAKSAPAATADHRPAQPIQPKSSAPSRVVRRSRAASPVQPSAEPLAAPAGNIASDSASTNTATAAGAPSAASGDAGGGDGGPGAGHGGGNGSGSGSGGGPGSGDLRAQCLRCPAPLYPRIARMRGWEGTVHIDVVLQRDGQVENASIEESSGHDVLDSAALAAARQSRFRLATGAITHGRIAYGFRLSRVE